MRTSKQTNNSSEDPDTRLYAGIALKGEDKKLFIRIVNDEKRDIKKKMPEADDKTISKMINPASVLLKLIKKEGISRYGKAVAS
ncbi:hypothetical protein BH10BAC5_BH10BAC5_17220 [soil metagenome]